jgi:hypothetical protein
LDLNVDKLISSLVRLDDELVGINWVDCFSWWYDTSVCSLLFGLYAAQCVSHLLIFYILK